MDFDPVTGNLWDTENGPDFGDEINLVEPGSNSGWAEVTGLASAPENEGIDIEEDLVDFNGRGNYSDPEFIWQETVAPTAIKFFDSTKLGAQYENENRCEKPKRPFDQVRAKDSFEKAVETLNQPLQEILRTTGHSFHLPGSKLREND